MTPRGAIPCAIARVDMSVLHVVQRLLEDCDGTEGSGIDYQPPVLLEHNDGAVIPPFASGHVAAASDGQHHIIPRGYALSAAGLTTESLAHVRERLAGKSLVMPVFPRRAKELLL